MGSGTPEEAIRQIKEKGYAEPYRMSGKNIISIGAAFADGIDGASPGSWITEEPT